MPIADFDIRRAADILIKPRGNDAAIVAAQRADDLLAAGDIAGEIVCKPIAQAIAGWEQDKPVGKLS